MAGVNLTTAYTDQLVKKNPYLRVLVYCLLLNFVFSLAWVAFFSGHLIRKSQVPEDLLTNSLFSVPGDGLMLWLVGFAIGGVLLGRFAVTAAPLSLGMLWWVVLSALAGAWWALLLSHIVMIVPFLLGVPYLDVVLELAPVTANWPAVLVAGAAAAFVYWLTWTSRLLAEPADEFAVESIMTTEPPTGEVSRKG